MSVERWARSAERVLGSLARDWWMGRLAGTEAGRIGVVSLAVI